MKAALVLVDWDAETSYCHVFKGDNPLESAHALFNKIRGEFPDCDFAFVSDEAARRRYGEHAFRRSAALSHAALHAKAAAARFPEPTETESASS
jgi:hypothetical protein